MKTLAICGDSFNAVSKTHPETHYSEIVADRLGWRLRNFARRGCSNGGIRLQINECVEQRVDFVIVAPTGWDRMELPIRDNFYESDGGIKKFGNLMQNFLLEKSKSSYDPDIGMRNINYNSKQENSMVFETIFSLAENLTHEYRKSKLSKEKVEALKHYINHIYDSGWKQQQDKWIISEGLSQLHDKGIPFSVERGMLWADRDDIKKTVPSFIEDKYIRQDFELIGTGCHLHPLKDISNDPGYHSEPEGQLWIADLYVRLMRETYNLC